MWNYWIALAWKLKSEGFSHYGSNGADSDLPSMATTPKSSSTAVKLQQLAGGETMTFGGCGWSGIEKGVVGNKTGGVIQNRRKFWGSRVEKVAGFSS